MSFRDDDSGGSHLHRPYFQSQRSEGSDLTNHHPIDLNSYLNNTTTAFKSQGGFLSSDNSMEYPFTNAQWKELERQAMIYKYMVASIPIPIDLLIPSFSSTTPIISSSPNLVRYANGKVDMEPGRCKRTDGKKWRCSRDVAPNQKYCERHMNRGRPRSRKHVEQQQQQQRQRQQTCLNDSNIPKKPRHDDTTYNTLSIQALTRSNNNHITNMTQNSHFLGVEVGSSATTNSLQPYHHYPYLNNFDYSRNLEWEMKTEEQQQWLHLMQSKMEITGNPHEGLGEESFLNLSRDCTALFLNPDDNNNTDVISDQPSRSFIDAWSKTKTTTTVENSETTDVGTLSPASLTLSMGNWVNPNPSPCSWVSPLAEVLRPSAAAAAVVGDGGDSGSPLARSPSGVLQKTTMTSLSDSSNCSSPKLKPEIALF